VSLGDCFRAEVGGQRSGWETRFRAYRYVRYSGAILETAVGDYLGRDLGVGDGDFGGALRVRRVDCLQCMCFAISLCYRLSLHA
jgi:hypothetical protein